MTDQEEYERMVSREIEEYRDKLASLKARALVAGPRRRARIFTRIQVLQDMKERLVRQFEDLRNSGGRDWEAQRQALEGTWMQLKSEFRNTAETLGL
ncbi:MAG: hypothetical protein ACLFOY_12630 [Desulfatibacillaceae bacterium]